MKQAFKSGVLESAKFAHLREPYYEGLQRMREMDYSFEDLIHHFPCFVGHQTLLRFLNLYEYYKMTHLFAGHIAEVGVYKAACSLFFAKLIHIYEPHGLTLVHGFDSFQGMLPSKNAKYEQGIQRNSYKESEARVRELVSIQGLQNIFHLHEMDVTKKLRRFMSDNPHLQFKLVLLDAGTYDVVRIVLPLFWKRVVPGGVIVLDQYNFDASAGETVAVRECLPDVTVRVLNPSWMPTAYIVKS